MDVNWVTVTQSLGFPIVVAGYLLYRSHIQEARIMDRVADLETYIRQRLERIIEEATSAITEFNRKANK